MAIICIAILVFLGVSSLGDRLARIGNPAGDPQALEKLEKELLRGFEAERQALRNDHYALLQAWERMKRITGEAEKRS